jgi:AcrR family transcriptional regulator
MMRSLMAEARAARHIAVIDEATLEFTRDGVAGASLSSIAKRVGLTRAALYNYCTDRQDLVFQCYRRSCSLTQSDLLRAYQTPASGAERLGMFLKVSVDLDHYPVAVLSEIAVLNDEQQATVRKDRAKNVELLKTLLREGQQDGSIRDCDLDVVCQAIFGVLSWGPLARIWLKKDQKEFAARMAAAIPDMVMNGVVPLGNRFPTVHRRIAEILDDTPRTEREQRLEEFARTGSKLFNRRGIAGVSFDEIALEMGVTKGALYHHFESKPEFVAFCYARAFDIYERVMDAAEACETGLEATMTAIELDVEAQLTDIYPLWLTTGLGTVPAKMRLKLAKRNERLAARSFELARRGIADGSLRSFDLEPVKLAAPGSFTYLSTWLPPADERGAAQIAQEVSRFLLLGLRRR